jgi:hypothetical protein
MNPSAKIAFVFFVILASPTASFARASGQEEATGHLRGVQPNVDAINVLDNVVGHQGALRRRLQLFPKPYVRSEGFHRVD